jgi:hypothetical protein
MPDSKRNDRSGMPQNIAGGRRKSRKTKVEKRVEDGPPSRDAFSVFPLREAWEGGGGSGESRARKKHNENREPKMRAGICEDLVQELPDRAIEVDRVVAGAIGVRVLSLLKAHVVKYVHGFVFHLLLHALGPGPNEYKPLHLQ